MASDRTIADINITLQQRQQTHGDYPTTADYYEQLCYAWRSRHDLPAPVRFALDNYAHKIARILSGDPMFEDHYHDIAGYSECVLRWIKKEKSDGSQEGSVQQGA
jgi:hypothetical protein